MPIIDTKMQMVKSSDRRGKQAQEHLIKRIIYSHHKIGDHHSDRRRHKKTNATASSMFQDNPSHYVGYTFANINSFFKPFKDFFPFKQFDCIFFFDKKIGDDDS